MLLRLTGCGRAQRALKGLPHLHHPGFTALTATLREVRAESGAASSWTERLIMFWGGVRSQSCSKTSVEGKAKAVAT